ncbi:MAG: glutathione S-transferase family protein [Kofleriaceae bacterium]
MTNQALLLGPPQSSYVRSARMTCLEKQVPHALEPIELGSDPHQKLHPWSRVPVLRHAGLTLYETSAILRYLDEVGSGPRLVPATAAARAVMEQWISAINCYLYDSIIRNYCLVYVGAALRKQPLDTARVALGVPNMQRDLARLDAAYAGGAWIAGDTISLADLLVAPIVQTVAMFPEGTAALATAPQLSRAFADLQRRDSFTQAHAGVFGP